MLNPARYKGRSFAWGFVLFAALFLGANSFGQSIGLSGAGVALITSISGFIPFTIQAFTGCALDRTWVARYSRAESPIKYWSLLIFSAAFGTVFALIANRFT